MKYPVGTILIFNAERSRRRVVRHDNSHYTLEVLDDNGTTNIGYHGYYSHKWVEDLNNYSLDEDSVVDKILEKYSN